QHWQRAGQDSGAAWFSYSSEDAMSFQSLCRKMLTSFRGAARPADGTRRKNALRRRPFLEVLEDRYAPAAFTVKVRGESLGLVTLRKQIANANANPGSTVNFGVDDVDLLSSPLIITAPTTINATGHTVTIDGGHSVQDFIILPS